MITVIIRGEFPGLNEFIAANRRRNGNWSGGNTMKQRDQNIIAAQLPKIHTDSPIWIDYRFFCPNRKKDKDNISGYFHKVFQDALVARRVINNDGWKDIEGFSDRFYIDRKDPRVEVEIREIGGVQYEYERIFDKRDQCSL